MSAPSPFIFWLKELKDLNTKKNWLTPGPVYAASIMILAVAVLTFALTGNISRAKPQRQTQVISAETSQTAFSKPPPAHEAESGVKAPNGPASLAKDSSAIHKLAGAVLLDFGWRRHPVLQDWRYHNGVDVEYKKNEPVKAVYSGEVSRIYKDHDCGLTAVITSGKTTVYYSSLSGVDIAVGQAVTAGQMIGNAGECALEPYEHLHLVVKSGDKCVDPRELPILAD